MPSLPEVGSVPRARCKLLVFAVGDIHGMAQKLESLVERCRAYAVGRAHRFIFLGDYVDRGSNSRGVIELLMGLQGDMNPPILIKGNHEQMLLNAVASPEAELGWNLNGGASTLKSYGIANAFEMPDDHLRWFRSLTLMFDDGLRLYVHAGIYPSRALTRQKPEHLLWIREPFLSSKREFGRLIVHGHTPTETMTPDLRVNRLNIDTGAVYGGPLTAAVFTESEREPVCFIESSAG